MEEPIIPHTGRFNNDFVESIRNLCKLLGLSIPKIMVLRHNTENKLMVFMRSPSLGKNERLEFIVDFSNVDMDNMKDEELIAHGTKQIEHELYENFQFLVEADEQNDVLKASDEDLKNISDAISFDLRCLTGYSSSYVKVSTEKHFVLVDIRIKELDYEKFVNIPYEEVYSNAETSDQFIVNIERVVSDQVIRTVLTSLCVLIRHKYKKN